MKPFLIVMTHGLERTGYVALIVALVLLVPGLGFSADPPAQQGVPVYESVAGTPHIIGDAGMIGRLKKGLARLDARGIPPTREGRIQAAVRAFPDLTADAFPGCDEVRMYRADLDGAPPADYLLKISYCDGSAQEYKYLIALRKGQALTYQVLAGDLRGGFQWTARHRKHIDLSALCKGPPVAEGVCDLDGDGITDVYVVETVEGEEEFAFVLVPYFWNGERMSSAGRKTVAYYERVLTFLAGRPEASAIRKEIKQRLRKRERLGP